MLRRRGRVGRQVLSKETKNIRNSLFARVFPFQLVMLCVFLSGLLLMNFLLEGEEFLRFLSKKHLDFFRKYQFIDYGFSVSDLET